MAYKMDNLRYGAMDDSYLDSMAQANDNSQDAQRWKLLADQARTNQAYDDNATIERQKELLAIKARKKKIIQEIDELKKELQQRTKLQAFEDKYKDSPFWKLAKKNYIDTGDMGAIDSFVTRENALQEANTNREFNREQNELNRANTFELNKAQKTEQLEYSLDYAQEKVELAMSKLKSAKALGNPAELRDAGITYNYAVKRLNDIREKLDMEPSEYKEELTANEKSDENNKSSERNVKEIILSIPKDYRYKTVAEKNKILKEIFEHPAYAEKDADLLKAYTEISKNKTSEEINASNESDEKKAKALWNGLSPYNKNRYQDGIISYDSNNPDHVLLNKFKATFGINWAGGK